MRLKKVHSTFLTAALACSLAVTPVFANPAEDAENLKNQKTEAESELSNLQTQFDTLIQKANELELKLIKTGEAIIQAQADLEAAEEKKEEQYEAMKKRIKFMYESGTGSATVEKVMTSGDMSSMLSQAEYSQKMHEYDREQLKEYTNPGSCKKSRRGTKSRGRTPQTGRGSKEQCDSGTAGDTFQSE